MVGTMRSRLRLFLAFAVLAACNGELPNVIRDEITTTSRVKAGAATVVFFTDFQCPHCRRTHAALAPLIAARRERVRLVLRHVPLPRHPDARTAARAVVCVERLTNDARGSVSDGYAHALFEAQDLSEAACEQMAAERGVDRERFHRCLYEPATDGRIEQDIAMFEALRGDGVPLLYIGSTKLDGAQTAARLEAALDDALGR
jgi:predicted DsbA family dithiol-disulfide isomerase